MTRRVRQAAQLLLQQRKWVTAAFQSGLVFFSLVFAWMLRFDFSLPYRRLLLTAIPVLIAIRLFAIARFNLLHGWWRYAGIQDMLDIGKAVMVGSVAFFLAFRYLFGMTEFPVSVYLLEALLTAASLAGVRLFSRVLAESVRKDRSSRRIVLIGAGLAAQSIIREIKQTTDEYVVVACVDDNPSKRHLKISGVPVMGTVDELPDLVGSCEADEILITAPSATAAQMRRFVEICGSCGLPFKTVPAIRDVLSGQVTMSQVREVELQDLLGRAPVHMDLDNVRKQLQGKVVMVTGAAGSIGSELCRQILQYAPARLICVDHSETGMFYLERELKVRAGATQLVCTVTDIRNSERMRKLFSSCAVSYVFHAAAYKHVPVMESNVPEAVSNNVFGLLHVLTQAEESGCDAFVLISSDKAVNPTSVMGCTKRIGELILAAWPADGMRCVSVRFGNVLGSSGSVVPVFREQLRNNQPLTVTHPEIRRFFMTITEAVSLVLEAFSIGKHGEILVLDMGEPVRILDLAQTLIRVSGKPRDRVPIVFTGLRQGEKLFEELFYPYERVLPTSCAKIRRSEAPLMSCPELKRQLDELRASLSVDGAAPVRAAIRKIVPEYTISPAIKVTRGSTVADETSKFAG